MTAARPMPKKTLRLLQVLDDRIWHVFTFGLGLGLILLGINYGLGGDGAAGRSFVTVRNLMSVPAFGVVTLLVGALVWAAMSTRWVVVALWLAFLWSGIAAFWLAWGAQITQTGGAGVVLWGAILAPAALILMLIAPDKSGVYLVIAWWQGHAHRRRERRGGAA